MHHLSSFVGQTICLGHPCQDIISVRYLSGECKIPTMFAQHFDHKPAFCPVWSVLNAHVAAVNPSVSPTGVIRATFED